MRVLYLLLRDRDVDGIRVAALTVGAVFFSGANVFVLNTVHPRGFWQLGVVFVTAVLSLTVIVRAIQRLFLASWAAPVLGKWLYKSSSENWGLATIDIRSGDLRYTVQLYRTESEALSASRQESGAVASCFATVTSTGVTYHAGEMELIYKIDRTSGDYAP